MSRRERLLRAEAAVYLIVAKLALELVPFRWLVHVFERELRAPELHGAARGAARREVRRAVHHVALPLRMACFPKAIAAQAMLRRRGVPTTLYWGAARLPGEGLSGHAWLQDGEAGVVGSHAAVPYTALRSFSGSHSSEGVR